MLLNLDWRVEVLGEGDESFSIKIKPLEYEAYQKVLGLFDMNLANKSGLTEKQKDKLARDFNPMTSPKMLVIMKEIMPAHAKDLTGLTLQIDGEKRPATVEDLCTISQLLVLGTQIFMKIFDISNIVSTKEGARGEVKKQLPVSSENTG